MDRGELEEHLTNTYSDDLRHIPLQVRRDIPVVPLPTSIFSLTSPSLEEVRSVIRKARNRSAPGPNGVPHLLYKRCPKVLYLLLPHRESMAVRQDRLFIYYLFD